MDYNIIKGRSVLTNASDVFSGTLSVNDTEYTDGGIYICQMPITNTTTTPTLNINSIGAKTIVDLSGNSLKVGDLRLSGWYQFMYDLASTKFIVLNIKQINCEIQLAVSDETTALTTGTAKITFRMPYAMTLTEVRGGVTTCPTGGTLLTVDINESGSTILSTKLTFDASEYTTTTAATPAVISDSSLADDAQITIDIDAIGSTIAGTGLKILLKGVRV
jgi:hypothetical protein